MQDSHGFLLGSFKYPLVNVYIANWKITIFNRQINYFYGPFSIAMLNYQRVYNKKKCVICVSFNPLLG